MTTCWACETALRPEWKYCIHCGVPVESDGQAIAAGQRPASPLALFGWIFAGLGCAIAITAAVVFAVSR